MSEAPAQSLAPTGSPAPTGSLAPADGGAEPAEPTQLARTGNGHG